MLPKRFHDSKQYKPIEENTRSTTVGCWRCLALFSETSKIARYPFLTRFTLMLNLTLILASALTLPPVCCGPVLRLLRHCIIPYCKAQSRRHCLRTSRKTLSMPDYQRKVRPTRRCNGYFSPWDAQYYYPGMASILRAVHLL